MAKWLYKFCDIDIHAEEDAAFRYACYVGNLEIAKWLYSLGNVDIHACDNIVFTATSDSAVVEFLFDIDAHETSGEPFVLYGIEVSYSWGDCEDSLYGTYETKEKAYQEMCQLAAKEAYVQNEEFLVENTCSLHFDAAKKEIDLHYDKDDTWCYYRIKTFEEFERENQDVEERKTT